MKNNKIAWIAAIVFVLLSHQAATAQQADTTRMKDIVYYLASDELLGRGFGTEQGALAAAYIKDQFMESGIESLLETYFQPFSYRSGILNIEGNNVVGVVRGSDPELAGEYVILGAHYDHLGWKIEEGDTVVYNGADDNASGVAAVIELGRMLKEKQPARSVILVAFDGEESGLNGSEAFVEKLITAEDPMIKPEKVAAMFSLDMVGMYKKHKGVDLLGIELLVEGGDMVKKVSEISPINVSRSNDNVPMRTDTQPFGAVGIPSVHVFTGTESPYHEPEDDAELLDYSGMGTIVNFMAGLTGEIANHPDPERTRQLEAASEKGSMKRFNPGVFVNVGGSNHDYKNDYRKAKGVFASGAGLFIETRITQFLAFQPEVHYEFAGSQEDGGNLRTHSVTVPVTLLLTSPDPGNRGMRNYFQAGAYYSYAFAGSQGGAALDFVNDFNDTDYGLILGWGFEIMNARIGMVFKESFVDFSRNSPLDTRQKAVYARIGWAF